MNRAAVEVLVDNLRALDRAKAFAERINEPEVWSKLAKAQLDDENVHEAVASYIKAQDPRNYAEVIAVAQRDGAFEDLGKYLKMVRKQIKEPQVRNVGSTGQARAGRVLVQCPPVYWRSFPSFTTPRSLPSLTTASFHAWVIPPSPVCVRAGGYGVHLLAGEDGEADGAGGIRGGAQRGQHPVDRGAALRRGQLRGG